jgi:hypothetical protein
LPDGKNCSIIFTDLAYAVKHPAPVRQCSGLQLILLVRLPNIVRLGLLPLFAQSSGPENTDYAAANPDGKRRQDPA